MRDNLFHELGVLTPPIAVCVDDSLRAAEFRIQISGLEPASVTGLGADEFLVNDDIDGVRSLKLDAHRELSPDGASAGAVVSGGHEQAQICRAAGLTVWGPIGYLILQMSSHIRRAAPIFQSDLAARHMLDALAGAFPDPVERSLRRFGLPKLGQMMRHLLAEEIPVRDLLSIIELLLGLHATTDVDIDRFIVFESIAEPVCPDPTKRPVSELPASLLADYVRTRMKRAVSHKYTRGSGTLVVYLLTPPVEKWLRQQPDARPGEEGAERFLAAVRRELADGPASTTVLLTNFGVRGTAWRLLRDEFPRLSVLCYQELAPDLNIQPMGRIGWD